MMNKELVTVSLPLSGMDSEHCALIIDKGLQKIEGISQHTVELNNNRALITTDDEISIIRLFYFLTTI